MAKPAARRVVVDERPLQLCHPEHGVPLSTELLADGVQRSVFLTDDGDRVTLEHRLGQWVPAKLEEVEAKGEARAQESARRRGRDESAAVRRLADQFEEADGEVVCDQTGRLYGAVRIGSRLAVLDLDGLSGWLASTAARNGGLPTETAARGAAFGILAREPRATEVFVRLGWRADCSALWLDLGDAEGLAAEIDANGWRIVDRPGVLFRRPPASRALPLPEQGGDLNELAQLAGLAAEARTLVFTWLVGVLAPRGPYPLLSLQGAKGSGKTTLAHWLKALVDPQGAPLRSLPHDDRGIAVAANGGFVLGFDNVSALSPAIADGLCRLSSGDGFATRQLYSDSGLTVMEAARPVVLTGIGEAPLVRADLADRVLAVTLSPRPHFISRRRLDELFNKARPRLLGALLTAASRALANVADAPEDDLPRMADFAEWVVAAERGGAFPWGEGEFLDAYANNRRDVVEAGIDNDSLAQAVIRATRNGAELTGSASELLASLAPANGAPKDWPGTPQAIGDRLRRIAPQLVSVGVEVRFRRGHGQRLWTIRRAEVTNAD